MAINLPNCEQVLRLIQGAIIMSGPNGKYSLKLDKAERNEFNQARERGYMIYTRSQGRLYEIWWYWCNATRQPFVVIKKIKRYAMVEFELCDPEVKLSEEGMTAVDASLMAFAKYSGYGTGPRSGCHPKVPIEATENLAAELLNIGHEHLQPNTPWPS